MIIVNTCFARTFKAFKLVIRYTEPIVMKQKLGDCSAHVSGISNVELFSFYVVFMY